MSSKNHNNEMTNNFQTKENELNCLYKIEELVTSNNLNIDKIFKGIVEVIPEGCNYPDFCKVNLIFDDISYHSPDYNETKWCQKSDLIIQGEIKGSIRVCYDENITDSDESPFTKDEIKLLSTITERVSQFLLHNKLEKAFNQLRIEKERMASNVVEWQIVLDMLRRTDPNLFYKISRKMLHHLCWSGIKEADDLLYEYSHVKKSQESEFNEDENKPIKKKVIINNLQFSANVFKIADDYLSDNEILLRIHKWIQEDKSSALVKVLENMDTTLADIADAIRRFQHLAPEGIELPPSTEKGLHVSLIRRFFTDQLQFISIAKDYVTVYDFYNLLQKMIYPAESHGKLGGKSAGMFLASQILKRSSNQFPIIKDIKTPKTWFITSDGVLIFMQYNNLEEVVEQKYKEIDQVRLEYPNIVQVFKNSQFPPDLINGLSVALDDFGDNPLVVRSSSLLEDRMGAAFSGKYKSLFLANQGNKEEKLNALIDAIEEVYASTFSPDPIEYRGERGLIDFHEEMGIMIQEVVGKKIGKYFLPAYAGVAFSNNEFRWSPRIKREDGLVRLVPGLGTRAVDRVSDDYPVLVSPGQPGLRANVTFEEILKYSPKKIDLINLKTNQFETITLEEFIAETPDAFQHFNQILSIIDHHIIRRPIGLELDHEGKDFVVTFEGLVSGTNFMAMIQTVLNVLKEKLKTPVDIEFACDGQDFYILQCRPQSFTEGNVAVPIPKDIPQKDILFNAKKFISNGLVPSITHIVYVEPNAYSQLVKREDMVTVGRIVGRLNKLLPKRQFILMGPGRWGSRGDIKLGVNVTYSDISNTSLLIEIARQKGNYIPDLSFGTHFFQDLVESSIRYLPLYPDNSGIVFNEEFLIQSENMLLEILPEYESFKDIVRVIDVTKVKKNNVLVVAMNADMDEALAYFTDAQFVPEVKEKSAFEFYEQKPEDHWRWRWRMTEQIATHLDSDKFGVKGLYIFGSTKNGTAKANSDIDLIVHYDGSVEKRKCLEIWMEGWSLCLDELNYLRTGHRLHGILDVHYVTDIDIVNRESYAAKIDAATDPARKLILKKFIKSQKK